MARRAMTFPTASRFAHLAVVLLVILGGGTWARAEVDWRISIKIIADAAGNIPSSTVARVTDEVLLANRILGKAQRGFGFDLVEVVTVPGVSQWYNSDPHDSTTRENLQEAARENPDLYHYRTDAVNIYVLGDLSGTCAFPPDDDVILMGRIPYSTLLLHETGHFFNLYHTHEGQRSTFVDGRTCFDGCDTCPRLIAGETDGTAETAPDHTCFDSRNEMAMNLFGVAFADLDLARQTPINNTWSNIMSYHGGGVALAVLTPDQLDRMTNESNSRRRNVATGNTWFVSTDGRDSNSGRNSTNRMQTVNRALQASQPRDIILLRSGTFNTPATITQAVTLCGSRGEVQLVGP